MKEIKVYSDSPALTIATAALFVELAQKAIAETGRFTVALSGGSTPKAIYAKLATPEYARQVDWSKVHLFWGDERCVPPDNLDSNYNMTRMAMLSALPIPAGNIQRMRGELEPAQAAQAYEEILRRYFEAAKPGFDLVLLGMGDDGHTASLFPGTAAVHEDKRWAIENYVEKLKMWRLTLTPPIINAAKTVAFVVAGESKAARLKSVLEGKSKPDEQPSQIIQPTTGKLLWLLDEAAAKLLKNAQR
jgi:6-phosphogluconolactonase